MNISSVVVQTGPEHLKSVLASLCSSGVCDYHFHDELGRIIVTIEGEGVEEELEKLHIIEKIDHVAAANMIYAYSEEELNAEREKLAAQNGVMPEWLNDENADIGAVSYGGDLKKIH